MAGRATVAQVTQIGVESTPGTGVAANKLLASLEITGGMMTYGEVVYPLSSILKAVTPTSDTTTGKK